MCNCHWNSRRILFSLSSSFFSVPQKNKWNIDIRIHLTQKTASWTSFLSLLKYNISIKIFFISLYNIKHNCNKKRKGAATHACTSYKKAEMLVYSLSQCWSVLFSRTDHPKLLPGQKLKDHYKDLATYLLPVLFHWLSFL